MKQGFVLLSLAIMLFSGALDAQLIIRDQKIQAQVDRAELQTVPHVLKYSGVIEQENEIQMNGEFEFEFVIYDNQAGERIIWSNNKTVEIEDGKFEVNFGDFEPLNLSLNVPYWLDIMVNGERIGSRLCVVSTGSALKVKALTSDDNTLAAASSAGKSTGGFKNKTDQSLTEYYDERYVNDNQNEVEGDKDVVDETITSADVKNGSLTGVDIQDESIGASKIIDGHGSSLDADKLDGHEATAFAFEGSYVKLQQETPGAQQQGNLNVSGTGLFGGKLGIGTMSPNYQLTIRNTDNHSRLSVGEDDNLSGDIGWDFTDKLLFVSTAFYNYPIRIGNNWMYFNSRGNVGIGTTSPNDKLEVSEGSIRIAGNGLMGQGNLKLIDTSQIDPAGRWGIDSYSNKLRILQATAPNYAGWEEKVVIDNSGKVGIGLNAPNESQLNIIGVSPQITIRDSNAGVNQKIGVDGLGLSLHYDNGSALTVDRSDGNVGIGTTNPAYKLDVAGDIRSTGTIYGSFAGSIDNADKLDGKHNGEVSADVVDGLHGSQFVRNDLSGSINGDFHIIGKTRTGIDCPTESQLNVSGENPQLTIRDTNAGVNQKIGIDGNGLSLWYDGGQALTVTRVFGKVGIGTTNPQAKLHVDGDLCVTGEKNAIVPTSQGMTRLYCDESTELWFSDRGFGKLSEGSVHIDLDPLYLETVTINEEYPIMVDIEFYGPHGNYYVKRGVTGFDVVDPDRSSSEFSWRVDAKRKGYENDRMESVGAVREEGK